MVLAGLCQRCARASGRLEAELRRPVPGDLSAAEIDRIYKAALAEIQSRPRRDDALVSCSPSSSLNGVHGAPRFRSGAQAR